MGGKGSEDNKWGKMREEKRNPGARIGIGLSLLFSPLADGERERKQMPGNAYMHTPDGEGKIRRRALLLLFGQLPKAALVRGNRTAR